MSDRDRPSRHTMTFLEHLEELRQRLLRSAVAVVLGMALGWFAAPYVLDWMIAHTVGEAHVFSPIEAFGERFKLALALGVSLALPAVSYQIWAFVVPGLLGRERLLLLPLVIGSMVLFVAGVATSVFVVVPIALEALQQFVTPAMSVEFRLSYVLGFVYNLSIATGIVFQLPLVVGALTMLRVVSSRFLVRRWRLAIVSAVVVSALITPGDVVIAQLLLGLPLRLLYGLSVGLAWGLERLYPREGPALMDSLAEDSHS